MMDYPKPKMHPGLPDAYSVEVTYKSGTVKKYEVASSGFHWNVGLLELRTVADEIIQIRLTEVEELHWDKRFSVTMDIVAEMKAKEKEQQNVPGGPTQESPGSAQPPAVSTIQRKARKS